DRTGHGRRVEPEPSRPGSRPPPLGQRGLASATGRPACRKPSAIADLNEDRGSPRSMVVFCRQAVHSSAWPYPSIAAFLRPAWCTRADSPPAAEPLPAKRRRGRRTAPPPGPLPEAERGSRTCLSPPLRLGEGAEKRGFVR